MRGLSPETPAPEPVRLENGVYVNYTLDLSSIEAIGFDLDHTLAVYREHSVNSAAFSETCRRLVDHRGYPPPVAGLVYDSSDAARGLLADTTLGNLVKLGAGDQVCRARRGSVYLEPRYIKDTYGVGPFQGLAGGNYQVHCPFDRPTAALWSVLSATLASSEDFQRVLRDVVEALDEAHRFGELKRRILSRPESFVERPAEVHGMLARFRDAGIKLFLLTNSGHDYADALMNYLFPAGRRGGWVDLFDEVVVDAGKPDFFADPARAAALESRIGASGASVLYIGDNPRADARPARERGWRTALIVPELGDDGERPDLPCPEGTAGNGWGGIFRDENGPTRFARTVSETADVFAARVEQIVSVGPGAVLPGVESSF